MSATREHTATAPMIQSSIDPEGGLAKRLLKAVGNALGLAIVALPAATCWIEARFSTRSEAFLFWGQALSLAPGLPGKYARRAYYHLMLRSCDLSCDIGFLSYFNDRRSEIGPRVYVGSGTSIGLVTLGEGCLIGSRASLINGGDQHRFSLDGRLTPFDPLSVQRVHIGSNSWIGEGAIVMADVGSRCIVAAGGVVTQPVPDSCVVGGIPARFIRKSNTTPEVTIPTNVG